ncbi:hypothetical protein PIB30_086713 [Stylosanthes scabra]|uniref:Aminotransferase-like plant mobile domain-containing protein n=1 Tax=Stylosanthes scabra TaxID=79078 RepID=A0ABU6TVI6_9FABA|nr:hypothetical protein [Stylosanthes scabra]
MAMTQEQLTKAATEATSVIYRLDRISHVSHNINIEAAPDGFRSMPKAILGDCQTIATGAAKRALVQVGLPLVSAFVERWCPETHSFHMPRGECTIILHDLAYQLGLLVDGEPVSECLSEFQQFMLGVRRPA